MFMVMSFGHFNIMSPVWMGYRPVIIALLVGVHMC